MSRAVEPRLLRAALLDLGERAPVALPPGLGAEGHPEIGPLVFEYRVDLPGLPGLVVVVEGLFDNSSRRWTSKARATFDGRVPDGVDYELASGGGLAWSLVVHREGRLVRRVLLSHTVKE